MDDKLQSLAKLSQFTRVTLETDVDPEDEETFGWTALVLIDEFEPDESEFLEHWAMTPENAVDGLIEDLLEKEYVTSEEIL